MNESVIQANRWKFFTVGAVGTFMATFDGSIMNVALPTITESLHTDVSTVAWVVLSYSLTLISLMMVFGAWTEHRGYKFAYTFGYVFFLVGSILCAFSPTINTLIFARVVQAVGTAMFAAIGPGMVTQVFPPAERGKGIGMMIMMVAGGFMIGPPVGGLLLSAFGWHSIFTINIPIALFGLYLIQRYFQALPPHEATRKIHIGGAISIGISLVALVFALDLMHDYSPADPRVIGLLVLSLAAGFAFLRFESRPHTALIGLDIFKRNKVFTFSILSQSVQFIASSGVFVLIPFYLQNIRGYEPKQIGLLLIVLPVLMFVMAPLAGKLSDKIGFAVLTTSGMVVTALGLLVLSRLEPNSSGLFIVAALAVLGVGTGLFTTPNSSALMGSVRPDQRAVTSGIMATNRNIGMSVGIALATSLFTYLEKRNAGLGDDASIFMASYRPIIYLGAALATMGVFFCWVRGERAQE